MIEEEHLWIMRSVNFRHVNSSARHMGRNHSFLGLLFDFIMVLLTGGLWLIWVLIRYLRTH